MSAQSVELAQVFTAWQSELKEPRERAEAFVEQQIEANADQFFSSVCELLESSTDQSTRNLIVILIRRRLAHPKKSADGSTLPTDTSRPPLFLTALSRETQQRVKECLLKCAVSDSSEKMRGQIVDCIAELGIALSAGRREDAWLELVAFSSNLVADSSRLDDRLNGLQILAFLCEQAFHLVLPHIDDILTLYRKCLSDKSPKLKIAALDSIAYTMSSMESSKCKVFAPMLASALGLLREVLKHETTQVTKRRYAAGDGHTADGCRDEHCAEHCDDDLDDSFPLTYSMLEILSRIAQTEGTLFAKCLTDYSKAMLGIATSKRLPDSLRVAALGVLRALANSQPSMCRKSEEFVRSIIEVTCASFLVESCSDEDWDEFAYGPMEDANDLVSAGEFALDNFCASLGGPVLVPLMLKRMNGFWKATQWRQRAAVLTAVTQVSEYIEDHKLAHSLLDRCVLYISDANHRIRYVAISAVGQLALDHSALFDEKIRIKTVRKLLDLLANAKVLATVSSSDDGGGDEETKSCGSGSLKKTEHWKVLAHAAACITNMVSNPYVKTDEDFLVVEETVSSKALADASGDSAEKSDAYFLESEGLLTPLLKRLFQLLSLSNRDVQEQALTAIAALAGSSQRLFTKYFDKFTPILVQIIQKATGEAQVQIRGRALECLSQIGAAVGSTVFKPVAAKLVPFTIDFFKNSALDGDEFLFRIAMQTWPLVASAIGADFVLYLDDIAPILVRGMAMDVEAVAVGAGVSDVLLAKICSQGEDWSQRLEENLFGEQRVSDVYVGSKRVVVNVSKIENKVAAIDVCEAICESLKHFVWPKLGVFFEAMVELCAYEYSDRVRQHAIVSLPTLVQCAVDAIHCDAGIEPALVEAMAVRALGTLVSTLEDDRAFNVMSDTCQTLADYLKTGPREIIRKCVDTRRLDSLLKTIVKCIGLSQRRVALLHESRRKAGAEFDAMDKEELEVEESCENELMINLSVVFGELIKIYGDAMADVMDANYKLLTALLKRKESSSFVRKTTLYVFCDLFEHLSASHSGKYCSVLVPLMLSTLRSDNDDDVRQVVFFLFGVMAMRTPAQLAPFAKDVLAPCFAFLDSVGRAYRARKCSVALAAVTDNVLAAMAKMVAHCRLQTLAGVNRDKVVAAFVAHLPIKVDNTEAVFCHALLLDLVKSRDAAIFRDSTEALPRAINLMADILKHQMGDDSLFRAIKEFARTLPPDFVARIPKDQKRLLEL